MSIVPPGDSHVGTRAEFRQTESNIAIAVRDAGKHGCIQWIQAVLSKLTAHYRCRPQLSRCHYNRRVQFPRG